MSTKTDMIPKFLWLVFFVGLFIRHSHSEVCNLMNVHLSRLMKENLRLLHSMSDPFPLRCLNQINDFRLPQNIFSSSQLVERDIKEVFYDISSYTFNIFSRHTSNSSSEEEYLTQINTKLSEQSRYLRECLEEGWNENEDLQEVKASEMDHSEVQVIEQNKLALKAYFQRIKKYLVDKKYSYCAWKIVQVELKRCFLYFLKFLQLLRRNKNHLLSSKN